MAPIRSSTNKDIGTCGTVVCVSDSHSFAKEKLLMPVKRQGLNVSVVRRNYEFGSVFSESSVVGVLCFGPKETVGHVNDAVGIKIHTLAFNIKRATVCILAVCDFKCIGKIVTVFGTHDEDVCSVINYKGQRAQRSVCS